MTPTIPTAGVIHAKVLVRKELAPGVVLMEFDASAFSDVTRPGQFVMIEPPGGGAAAVALGVYDVANGRFSVIFFAVGTRTRALASLSVGDSALVFGPLGNGFTLDGMRDVAIVAGGVGIASVLLPAKALLERGAKVTLYYGARSRALLVERERFASEGCRVLTSTDDGSDGHHGFVTELLATHGGEHDAILACGPTPMLRAVARVADRLNVRAQLSLEETFGCGVGGCWGCVVPIAATSLQAPGFPDAAHGGSDTVYARVCREGPVFFADELRWS